MAQNLYSRTENVTGQHSERETSARNRTWSESDVNMFMDSSCYMAAPSSTLSTQDMESPSMISPETPPQLNTPKEAECLTPNRKSMHSDIHCTSTSKLMFVEQNNTLRARTASCPEILICEESPP
eukprot:CAMPEP_0202472728 /NCGR_PEP_ID=MMETSP1360-20130828/88684_1 /ASSEMBLY_ACC=CAM_ASM_000848 /TAXON_ID=515479 /ORGANISM="Licmophora paradoxa, Strain CCMP2313" /LENGTH=124 /DNA_ID=CAMNT_0049099351 /DNA_START=20 /DNA_END=391 /DNA_ORIENTATION=+